MPSITIHIGSYKTGSTAIQQYLKRSRERLLEDKWIYPHAACRNDNAHHLLPFALQNTASDSSSGEAESFVQAILKEAKESSAENIVLSSEVFFSLRQAQIHKLATMLEGNSVQVVCYLRRQDEFIHSFYTQCIKESNVRLSAPPEDYDGFNRIIDIANYDQIISWWAEAFGQDSILLETFDKELKSAGVIPSFAKLVGIPNVDAELATLNSNLTIKTELIEYLRIINGLEISAAEHEKLLAQLNTLSRNNPELFSNSKFISVQKQSEVVGMYTEINESIRAQYFEDRDELFASDIRLGSANDDWSAPKLSTETLAQISAWLWLVQENTK